MRRTPPIVEAIESRRLLSADLSPSFAKSLPDSIPPGTTQKVTVRVANLGDAKATGAASVALYASSDGTFSGDDVRLGDAVRSLKLKPGKTSNVKVSVPSPTGLAAGPYTVFAAVDTSSSAIADANPANDVVSSPSVVNVPTFSVDLIGQFVNLPSYPLEAFAGGRSSSATVRVFNAGNVAAEGQLAVSVHLSADGTLDAADVPLGTSPVKTMAIKPGGKKDVKVTLGPPPATTSAGRYSLIAVVDPANTFAESDEANNTAVSPTQVPVVNTPPPHYDDDHHNDHGYYWTDTVYVDTYYYYDDGEWYYTDEPVIVDDGGYYEDDGGGYYDEGGGYYDGGAPWVEDEVPPPVYYDDPPMEYEPAPSDWYDEPATYDPPAYDPWDDYAGGDDAWYGDEW